MHEDLKRKSTFLGKKFVENSPYSLNKKDGGKGGWVRRSEFRIEEKKKKERGNAFTTKKQNHTTRKSIKAYPSLRAAGKGIMIREKVRSVRKRNITRKYNSKKSTKLQNRNKYRIGWNKTRKTTSKDHKRGNQLLKEVSITQKKGESPRKKET